MKWNSGKKLLTKYILNIFLKGQYKVKFRLNPFHLRKKSRKFNKTWNNNRTDLSDDSQSSIDQSIANIAAAYGYTPDQIAGLIALNRNHDTKSQRADYLERTISNALTWAESQVSVEVINNHTFKLPHISEIKVKPLVPVIRKTLYGDSIVMFYGDSGVGKSFLVYDMAVHIAAGIDWHGRKVTPGNVIIIII